MAANLRPVEIFGGAAVDHHAAIHDVDVVGEFAALPLVFGLPMVAIVFSLLNGLMLWVRIRDENEALGR